jgi:hypothetical protein
MSSLTQVLTEAQAETAIQILDDAQAAKLELLAAEIADIQARATSAPLQSQAELHRFNDLLGRAAKAEREIDAVRRSRVDPLNREVRNVNNLFAPITAALQELTARGKKLIRAWQAQERARAEREREEARLRAEEAARREAEALARSDADALAEAEAARNEVSAALLETPPPVPTGYRSEEATTTVRGRWVFEVVRPELVPAEYLTPNLQKIRAAVSAGVREIPGVSITQEDQVVVRAR